jgi:MarR family transcriptional repressor of emrRAB
VANVLGAVALDATTQVGAAIEQVTGVSMVQATALSALANYADGQSIDVLSRSVDLTHSATVRLVDRLAELQLVERRGIAGDRRVAAIHLTAAGRRTVRKVRRAREQVLTDWVARLSRADRTEFARILDKAAARDVAATESRTDNRNYLCRLCDPAACGHPERCPITEAGRAGRR